MIVRLMPALPGATLVGLLGEGEASRTSTESGHQVGGVGDLGLDIVGQPVGVTAREVSASRHGTSLLDGPHLLDTIVVGRVDNGGDVEEGQATEATEGDLTEHTGLVLLALGNGVEVANVLVREFDGLVLLVVDDNRLNIGVTSTGGEVDSALDIIESPEGDSRSVGDDCGSSKNHSSGELHFE